MNGTQNATELRHETWHGTTGGYTNHRCRCDDCRAANAETQRESKRRRLEKPIPYRVHGTANGYQNYQCRCELCRAAHGEDENQRKRRRRPYQTRSSQAERRQMESDWAEAKRVNRQINKAASQQEKLLKRIDRMLQGLPPVGRIAIPFEEMYTVNEISGCWSWDGPLHFGYGSYGGMNAHRYSYLLAGKVIPERWHIDHLCHTEDESCGGGNDCGHRSCVNPDHLEAVTQLENFTRGRSLGAIALREGVCSNGHPFVGDNIVEERWDGRRECRQCNRDRCRRYRAAKKLLKAA